MTEVRVRWVEGGQFAADAVTSGHSVVVDGGPDYGGTDRGARPMEMLLIALGGCTGVAVAEILRLKRQPVTGLEIIVRGERAEEWPKECTSISIEYLVRGNGISERAVARAIQLSNEKYCSVANSLKANVSSTYRIVEK